MHRWLVRQFYGLPLLRAILWRYKVKHGATIHGVAWIPARANRNLGFTITIDIACRYADVVGFGEVLGQNMLFPVRIAVPHKLSFVGEHDVSFAIAIYVCLRHAITALDFVIDSNGAKLWFRQI